MDVSTDILRAMLQSAWDQAPDGEGSLRDQLTANSTASMGLILGGSVSSASKNSASVSYFSFGPGRLTQVQVTESWSQLVRLFDCTLKWITAYLANPTAPCFWWVANFPAPPADKTDQTVFNWMNAALPNIAESYSDMTEFWLFGHGLPVPNGLFAW